MGYPDVTFRTELSPTTRKELESLCGQLQGILSSAGIKADGSFLLSRVDELDAGEVNADRVVTRLLLTPENVDAISNYPVVPSADPLMRIGFDFVASGLAPTEVWTPAIGIDETGFVGMGTKTPIARLTIAHGNLYISDGQVDSTADGYLRLRYNSGIDTGVIIALKNSVEKALSIYGSPVTLLNTSGSVTLSVKTATVNIAGLPTSPSGLATDDIWIDGGAGRALRVVGSSALGSRRLVAYSTTQVGNIGGAEDDLISLTIPAATLSENGMQLHARFVGSFANNANEKRVKVKFGATTIVDLGTGWTPNALTWIAEVRVTRTGATTQLVDGTLLIGGLASPVFTFVSTAAETLSGAVTLKATGESVAAATDDVVCQSGWVELAH